MRIVFACPACQAPQSQLVPAERQTLTCVACGFEKEIPPRPADDSPPSRCLLCGCNDLWRQKDFPQRLGVAMVAAGAILSTIAWKYYRPMLAIGILMGFALIDLLLYTFMQDMLVCYRCGTRFRRTQIDAEHPAFDLELNERYRQESIRLNEQQRPS